MILVAFVKHVSQPLLFLNVLHKFAHLKPAFILYFQQEATKQIAKII